MSSLVNPLTSYTGHIGGFISFALPVSLLGSDTTLTTFDELVKVCKVARLSYVTSSCPSDGGGQHAATR